MSFPTGSWDAWSTWSGWPELNAHDHLTEQESEQSSYFEDPHSYVSTQFIPCSDYQPERTALNPSTDSCLTARCPTYAVQDVPTLASDRNGPQDQDTPLFGFTYADLLPQSQQDPTQGTNHDSRNSFPALSSPIHSSFTNTLPDAIATCTPSRKRSEPYPSHDLDQPTPRRQNPRFEGDEYTARWIRGEGADRAGWCGICSSWHRLKDSTYWYHMQYSHGISCATGKPFRAPQRSRHAQGLVGFEAQCGSCHEWVYVGRSERWNTSYYRHAYKCQLKRGPGLGRSRSRTISDSPRQRVSRPLQLR